MSNQDEAQGALAPWREPLARALHRNRALANSRYFQLATVRPDGRPANRTVVFRGFRDGSDALILISDRRSQKNQQIQRNAWSEICWYFPKTREQFRISGKLHAVEETTDSAVTQALRMQIWTAISHKAQEQFGWPMPGGIRTDDGEKESSSETSFSTGPSSASCASLPIAEPQQPAPHFSVILITPYRVDHLKLRGEPQNRYRYDLDEKQQWRQISLNP